jgi:Ribose/xylose/arabinose/galactoside ABC-type transport systems, permease components
MKPKTKLINGVTIRVLLFIFILIVFAIIKPAVLSPTNIVSMINDSIFNGIAALGMMVIMVTGNFDLSSTSIAMLSSYITLRFYMIIGYGGDFLTMFLIAGAVGACIAMINGFIAQKFNLSGFVVSIGTNLIFSSVFFIFLRSSYIKTMDMPQTLLKVRTTALLSFQTASGATANVNIGIVVLIVVAALLWFLLNKTQLGRGVYALGGDKVALERVGYDSMKITLLAYAIFGACAAAAGIYFYSNSGTFEPGMIADKGGDVIASAIFGGCNMREGKGSVGGILSGVAIITVIKSNLILLGVPVYYVAFSVGALILAGILISTLSENRLKKA